MYRSATERRHSVSLRGQDATGSRWVTAGMAVHSHECSSGLRPTEPFVRDGRHGLRSLSTKIRAIGRLLRISDGGVNNATARLQIYDLVSGESCGFRKRRICSACRLTSKSSRSGASTGRPCSMAPIPAARSQPPACIARRMRNGWPPDRAHRGRSIRQREHRKRGRRY